jgi:hypothetical protein
MSPASWSVLGTGSFAPNQALQKTAAAILVFPESKTYRAAAAAELFRSDAGEGRMARSAQQMAIDRFRQLLLGVTRRPDLCT